MEHCKLNVCNEHIFFSPDQTKHVHDKLFARDVMQWVPATRIHKKKEISKMFDIFSLGVIMIDIVSGPEGRSKYEDMKHEDNYKFIDLVKHNISL